MSKQQSLLNFFQKTTRTTNGDTTGSCMKDVKPMEKMTPKSADLCSKGYEEGTLVWAKYFSYPWWPSIICKDPETEKIMSKTGTQIHVVFLGGSHERGSVHKRSIIQFTGKKDSELSPGGKFFCRDKEFLDAVEEAQELLLLSKTDRLKRIESFEEDASADYSSSSSEKHKSPLKRRTKKSSCPLKLKRVRFASDDEGETPEDTDACMDASEANTDGQILGADRDDTISRNKESVSLDSFSITENSLSRETARPVNDEMDVDSSTLNEDEMLNNSMCSETDVSIYFNNSINEETKCFEDGGDNLDESCRNTNLSGVSKLSDFSLQEENFDVVSHFVHETLDFLSPELIRDACHRRPTDDGYDPRTLYVPESFVSKLTPAMQQWWKIKSRNFDTILFFKVGKFYEFYHMDAIVATRELNIALMKGEYAHCGFPEIAFERFSDILLSKNYKVARVEQTETPRMMSERLKTSVKSSKIDKTMRREICQRTTPGTRIVNPLDCEFTTYKNNYLLSIVEKVNDDGTVRYGVSFIDINMGKFHIGEFDDDRHDSSLKTLLAHFPPAEVLCEKNKISARLARIINALSCPVEYLNPSTEMWNSEEVLKYFKDSKCFLNADRIFSWPEGLLFVFPPDNLSGLVCNDNCRIGLKSLGGIIWYLQRCLIDHELLSMKDFVRYSPPSNEYIDGSDDKLPPRMVLDYATFENLEIFENENLPLENSLIGILDTCSTAFGKRLLRSWVASPLTNIEHICERLDAVEVLFKNSGALTELKRDLKSLPDVERLVMRIHALGVYGKNEDHPDHRAVLFEDLFYSKRKIELFTNSVLALDRSLDIVNVYSQKFDIKRSALLSRLFTLTSSGTDSSYAEISSKIKHFKNAFDFEDAKREGRILPVEGVDNEYDSINRQISEVERKLNDYLQQQCDYFNCTLSFTGTARNRYQLEIPASLCKNLPPDFELTSSRKSFNRYWTPYIKERLSELTNLEEMKENVLRTTMQNVFGSFDSLSALWNVLIGYISELDVLACFATWKANLSRSCRPVFVCDTRTPVLEITNGSHPVLSLIRSTFIPNDLVLGPKVSDNETDGRPIIVVTGPNMGGKSTFIRQTGLLVLLAHLGCHLPADKCILSPCDRIFTRIGASDKIIQGESTFYVELSETQTILKHATRRSLVLIDELGRGTSTFDGTAIAFAVLNEINANIGCRTLFSTHYHTLIDDCRSLKRVALGHMSCAMKNTSNIDEDIVFLYKFAEGACPKSHGFFAAKLANIPEEIVQMAMDKAKQFEKHYRYFQGFRSLCAIKKEEDIPAVIEQIQKLM